MFVGKSMANCGENGIEKPVFDSYIDPEKGEQKFAVICREKEIPEQYSAYKTGTICMPVKIVGRILEFLPDCMKNEEGVVYVLFNGEEVPARIAPMDNEEKRRALNRLRTIKEQMMLYYLMR